MPGTALAPSEAFSYDGGIYTVMSANPGADSFTAFRDNRLFVSLRWEPLMPRISLSPNRSGLTGVAALDRRQPTVVRPSTRMR